MKIHCSVLAEDAIKAAISDYKKKQRYGGQVGRHAPAADCDVTCRDRIEEALYGKVEE